MNTHPVLEWVVSHQDDDYTIDINDLSKGTQLNIKADRLATKGLNCLHTKPRVPLDPSSDVLIHQHGRTITRDLKSTLRSNIHLPVLKKHYKYKFGWSNIVYGYIDWNIFTPVYRRHKNNNLKWTNKFLTQKLPVGQRLHAKESKYDERCCSCWGDSETDDHLLQCPNRPRRCNEIYHVITSLTYEMDPVIHDILRDGIQKYLNGDKQTMYVVDNPTKRGYRGLQESQRAIR